MSWAVVVTASLTNRAHAVRDVLYGDTFCFTQAFLARSICLPPYLTRVAKGPMC